MMTVHEVSQITGVSARTLHYYDSIDLLKPTDFTEAGYRLYVREDLARLQQILLYKELGFSLKEIKNILDAPDFDQKKAMDQQIRLLIHKRDHLDALIDFARNIQKLGVITMDFSVFNPERMKIYAEEAKTRWGETDAYREYQNKTQAREVSEEEITMKNFMLIFTEFGQLKGLDPTDEQVRHFVKKLQKFITEHYYTCSDEILESLGQMYVADDAFTQNIDSAGGPGTAEFVSKAIEAFCYA